VLSRPRTAYSLSWSPAGAASKKAPSPRKRSTLLVLRLAIPRERLGALAQTVVSLTGLGMLSETVEVYLQMGESDEAKRRQLCSMVTETIDQLGGRLIKATNWDI
jgi:hypothetical protein